MPEEFLDDSSVSQNPENKRKVEIAPRPARETDQNEIGRILGEVEALAKANETPEKITQGSDAALDSLLKLRGGMIGVDLDSKTEGRRFEAIREELNQRILEFIAMPNLEQKKFDNNQLLVLGEIIQENIEKITSGKYTTVEKVTELTKAENLSADLRKRTQKEAVFGQGDTRIIIAQNVALGRINELRPEKEFAEAGIKEREKTQARDKQKKSETAEKLLALSVGLEAIETEIDLEKDPERVQELEEERRSLLIQNEAEKQRLADFDFFDSSAEKKKEINAAEASRLAEQTEQFTAIANSVNEMTNQLNLRSPDDVIEHLEVLNGALKKIDEQTAEIEVRTNVCRNLELRWKLEEARDKMQILRSELAYKRRRREDEKNMLERLQKLKEEGKFAVTGDERIDKYILDKILATNFKLIAKDIRKAEALPEKAKHELENRIIASALGEAIGQNSQNEEILGINLRKIHLDIEEEEKALSELENSKGGFLGRIKRIFDKEYQTKVKTLNEKIDSLKRAFLAEDERFRRVSETNIIYKAKQEMIEQELIADLPQAEKDRIKWTKERDQEERLKSGSSKRKTKMRAKLEETSRKYRLR